jgi:hypothetical protein
MTDSISTLPVGKVVTFSATVSESDVYLFAGIICSPLFRRQRES